MVAGNFFLLPAVVSIGCSQRRCTQEAQQGEGKARNRAEHSDGAVRLILPSPEQFLKQKPGCGSGPAKRKQQEVEKFLH